MIESLRIEQDLLVRSMRHANAGWRVFNVLITPVFATRMLYALFSVVVVIVNLFIEMALRTSG